MTAARGSLRSLGFAVAGEMRERARRAALCERGQGTVEYAVVLAGVMCVILGLAALWRLVDMGALVEHALMSASHHLQMTAAGSIADVFAF